MTIHADTVRRLRVERVASDIPLEVCTNLHNREPAGAPGPYHYEREHL